MIDRNKIIKEFRGKFKAEYITKTFVSDYFSGMKDVVLLKNIHCKDNNVSIDGAWVSYIKAFDNFMLKEGDEIEFVATLKPYIQKQKSIFRYGEEIVEIGYNFSNIKSLKMLEVKN